MLVYSSLFLVVVRDFDAPWNFLFFVCTDLLKYHVLPGNYYSRGLTSGQKTTLDGKNRVVTVNSGIFFFIIKPIYLNFH